jgi:16S rRNA (guanine527-N7)-methyltransferase
LEESQRLGFLGQPPVQRQVQHARAFASAWTELADGSRRHVLDLGSGGGLPGLVLGVEHPDLKLVLLEGSETRCSFLRRAVRGLGIADRVEVLEDRAESAGRDERWRGQFDVVVARSFGRPSVTAECAAPFLRPGGIAEISAPPSAGRESLQADRWPAQGLTSLHMAYVTTVAQPFRFDILRQAAPCPATYPRRVGVPAKRPLF